ncbi:MAG: DUF4179 domain-containing protein [Lachnospiraceae bacterium]
MNEKEYYVNQIDTIKVSDKMKQHVLQCESKTKKCYWRAISAVAVLAALALFVIPSPLSSKVNAYCEKAFYSINEMIFGEHADVSGYTTRLAQVDTDGDLSLQLNEVLLDGSHLICSYTVESETPKFFTEAEENSETYKGYYDLVIDKITINGKTKKYVKGSRPTAGFTVESTDARTYPVYDEICLCDFKEILDNPKEILDVKIEVSATNGEEDIRHFSYTFSVKNRELQLETKEIPLDQTFHQDDVTFTLEKMCINTHSQKIYFHVTGLPDRGEGIVSPNPEEDPYSFTLEGEDNNGNEVFAVIAEIRGGYGYFELYPYSDVVGLDNEVKFYDMQMEYDWDDPEHIVCGDEEEGIWYGKTGKVGNPFRIKCR